MTIGAFFFFVLFAIIQIVTYLAIRREWLAPTMVAGGGVIGSIVVFILFSLAQRNVIGHALVVGVLMGALINGITLAAAWYFHRNALATPPDGTQPDTMS